ncbi:hypothetical protein B551_0203295 [Cupriavidus sp. HPC(L)]|nr:hypothetical protein B551_0203295 [Cupriavidus sp. HPC(L)]
MQRRFATIARRPREPDFHPLPRIPIALRNAGRGWRQGAQQSP